MPRAKVTIVWEYDIPDDLYGCESLQEACEVDSEQYMDLIETLMETVDEPKLFKIEPL